MVPRRHDEGVHAIGARCGNAGRNRARARPVGAALFVVLPPRLVDRVVEPEREGDLGRISGEMPDLVEMREAIVQMPRGVVMPVRLAIARDDVVV